VNEAYMRLIRSSRVQWRDRVHFFAVTAQLMRRVLIDAARKRRNQKRGGALTRVVLDAADVASPAEGVDVLAVDEALRQLAEHAPRKARVVELRFFGGLSIEETAAALHVSVDIVKREWRTAKLWLLQTLDEGEHGRGALERD
jgi:RNA polymerase sigma factor (TIGR02999 family)